MFYGLVETRRLYSFIVSYSSCQCCYTVLFLWKQQEKKNKTFPVEKYIVDIELFIYLGRSDTRDGYLWNFKPKKAITFLIVERVLHIYLVSLLFSSSSFCFCVFFIVGVIIWSRVLLVAVNQNIMDVPMRVD